MAVAAAGDEALAVSGIATPAAGSNGKVSETGAAIAAVQSQQRDQQQQEGDERAAAGNQHQHQQANNSTATNESKTSNSSAAIWCGRGLTNSRFLGGWDD